MLLSHNIFASKESKSTVIFHYNPAKELAMLVYLFFKENMMFTIVFNDFSIKRWLLLTSVKTHICASHFMACIYDTHNL